MERDDPQVEPMAFHSEGAEQVLVDVHQVVRDLAGAVLADEHVGHRFTLARGLIQAMEVGPLPLSTPKDHAMERTADRCPLHF